jgi:hypothetical protein
MHATNPPPPDPDADAQPSLWEELASGSAGSAVKVAITVGLAPLLAGLALLVSYLFALWGWGGNYGWPGYTIPDDEVIGGLMVVAGLAYLAAVAWIWTRRRPKHRSLWGAALLTLGIAAVTVVLCIAAEDGIRGAEEVVIGGLVCVAIAAVVLTWVQAARRYGRAVPMRDRQDGALDVRCPSCGYRMVGLHESRCPECGTAYTLDELLGRQHFITGAHRQRAGSAAPPISHATSSPPPAPPPAGSKAGGAG